MSLLALVLITTLLTEVRDINMSRTTPYWPYWCMLQLSPLNLRLECSSCWRIVLKSAIFIKEI